jgi:hypothetical protein
VKANARIPSADVRLQTISVVANLVKIMLIEERSPASADILAVQSTVGPRLRLELPKALCRIMVKHPLHCNLDSQSTKPAEVEQHRANEG